MINNTDSGLLTSILPEKIKKAINKWTIIWLNTLNFMILKPTLMWHRIVQKKKNFHFISRRMHQIRFNLCNFLTHQKCHLFALPLLITATSARGLLLTVLTFVQIVNSNFVCVVRIFLFRRRGSLLRILLTTVAMLATPLKIWAVFA